MIHLVKTYSLWLLCGALRIFNRIFILCYYIFDLGFLQKREIFGDKLIRIFWLQIHQFMTVSDRCLVLRIILIPFDLALNLNIVVRKIYQWLLVLSKIKFQVWTTVLRLNLLILVHVHAVLAYVATKLREDEGLRHVQVIINLDGIAWFEWDLKASS